MPQNQGVIGNVQISCKHCSSPTAASYNVTFCLNCAIKPIFSLMVKKDAETLTSRNEFMLLHGSHLLSQCWNASAINNEWNCYGILVSHKHVLI